MFTIEELDLLITALQLYETIGIRSTIASGMMDGDVIDAQEVERLAQPLIEDCTILRAKLITTRRELQSAAVAGGLFNREQSVH